MSGLIPRYQLAKKGVSVVRYLLSSLIRLTVTLDLLRSSSNKEWNNSMTPKSLEAGIHARLMWLWFRARSLTGSVWSLSSCIVCCVYKGICGSETDTKVPVIKLVLHLSVWGRLQELNNNRSDAGRSLTSFFSLHRRMTTQAQTFLLQGEKNSFKVVKGFIYVITPKLKDISGCVNMLAVCRSENQTKSDFFSEWNKFKIF